MRSLTKLYEVVPTTSQSHQRRTTLASLEVVVEVDELDDLSPIHYHHHHRVVVAGRKVRRGLKLLTSSGGAPCAVGSSPNRLSSDDEIC